MVKSRARNSNLELLRIIAMLLIVMHHFAVHGITDASLYVKDKLVIDWLVDGGKVGVDIFIMISGY